MPPPPSRFVASVSPSARRVWRSTTKAGRYSTPIERARRPGSAEPGPSASSDGEDPSRPQQPPETPSGSVDRGIPVSASTNRSPVVVDGKQDVGTKHDGTR